MALKPHFRKVISGNYDSLPAAIAGFWIIQAFSQHGGIGVSPDSVVYISTAVNIHDHGKLSDFTNMPVMDFPAFYPIFLSGIIFCTGQGVLVFGPWLNGLLFASIIILSGWLMDRFAFPSKWYKWCFLLFIAFSPCLLEVYSMIWSETLFIGLTLLFFTSCHRYFRTHSLPSLLLMAGIASLACVTRYAGISLAALGAGLMFCDRRLPWSLKKIGHMAGYGGGSVLLLVLNLYRNQRLTGTLTGYREKGLTPFATNLHDFGSVFCDWLPFFNGHYGGALLVGAGFILLIMGVFLFRLVRSKDFFSYDTIALSYFIVYAGFILYTATVSRFQMLDSRLLSPLFLPWLWGSTCWIPALVSRKPASPQKIPWIVAFVIGAACFGWGEWKTFRFNWNGIHYAGIPGYTEDLWRKSPMLKYVRENKDSLQQAGMTYSNAFEGLWLLANVRSELIAHKDIPEDIRYMMKAPGFIVIWFNDAQNDDLIDIPYMQRYKRLVNVLHFPDGNIYFFRGKADSLQPAH